MPELPEVETVVRGLRPQLVSQIIHDIIIRRGDLRRPIPNDFKAQTIGATITDISRRAKYINMSLDNGRTIVIHLGMSGRMTFPDIEVGKNEPDYEKHDHVVFHIGRVEVRFNDPRRFGIVDVVDSHGINHNRYYHHLGAEPLDDIFDGHYLYEKLRNKKSPIKTAIMDQAIVVGVGNIYASESLFQAKIHPTKLAHNVTKKQTIALVAAIKDVLTKAIVSGGSSLNDYVQVSGELGYFQHAWQVYNRAGEPCGQCQTPIEKITQSNRGTYSCPKCQV